MRALLPLALSIVSGVLLALSLPPFDLEWLAWLALVPLLVASNNRRWLEGVGLGIIAAVACGAVHVPWTPRAYGIEYAVFPFMLLALMLGVWAPTVMSARRRWTGLPWCLLVASLGVALEWGTLFAPIPVHLALTQHRDGPVHLASVAGIWGVSLLVWLANAIVCDAFLERRVHHAHGLVAVPLTLFVIVSPVFFQPPKGGVVRVAAIQDCAATEGAAYGPASGAAEEPGDREALTRQAAADGAQLIVWPELGLGNSFAPELPSDDTVALARDLGVYLVVGYAESGNPKGFNCAALIAPDGQVLGVHRKNYPFLGERRSTASGTEATSFITPLGRVGMAICFDTCYPELPRRLVRSGAKIITMPNYDPVTPRGLVHHLHGAFLPFRAAESRAPIVRADVNGLSQVISATGRVSAEAPLYRAGIAAASVSLGIGRSTPFTRLGDWVAYLCLAAVAGFAVAALRRRLTSKQDVSESRSSGSVPARPPAPAAPDER